MSDQHKSDVSSENEAESSPTSGSNPSTAPTSTDALQALDNRRSGPTTSSSTPTDYDDDPFVSDSFLRYNNPPE